MRAMMEDIVTVLPRGVPVTSITVSVRAPEGAIAAGLEAVQKSFPDIAIGSYPFHDEQGAGAQLVARGRDAAEVERAARAIEAFLKDMGATAQRV
jgi:hypothetical protein